jgi:hypothetical protein
MLSYRYHQFISRRHGDPPHPRLHSRISVGSKLDEATAQYPGACLARQCDSHLDCRAADSHPIDGVDDRTSDVDRRRERLVRPRRASHRNRTCGAKIDGQVPEPESLGRQRTASGYASGISYSKIIRGPLGDWKSTATSKLRLRFAAPSACGNVVGI